MIPLDAPPPVQRVANDALRLVPLGGLGEIGMNCLVVEQADGALVVDCGVTFPECEMGIDTLHPRFDYLEARADLLAGVVITHGHEDHIGAVPYLLARLPVPVWAPPHALELLRERLRERGLDLDGSLLRPVQPRAPFRAGPFRVEPIRVTHSTADATGLALETSIGTVVHTGDFKLDAAPDDGEVTDEERLRELGDAGVRLLLSDSTNVDQAGSAGSEHEVAEALEAIVAAAPARVVVGLFASNIERLRRVGDLARRHRRAVCLLGRSLSTQVRVAAAVGRLRWPADLCVTPDVAARLPPREVLVLAGGTQAERASALARLSARTHPVLRLERGDVVALSSRAIPGHERAVSSMIDGLLRQGVEVHSRLTDPRLHVSGHAHRGEQARMLELVRPRAFLPVHGTLHHLTRHAALARSLGVAEVLVAEDGDVVELGRDRPLARCGSAPAGRVATCFGTVVSEETLRERAALGRAGIAIVALAVNPRGRLAARPSVACRGVLDEGRDADVLRAAERDVERVVAGAAPDASLENGEVVEALRRAVQRRLRERTGLRPSVLVQLVRVL